MFDNVPKRLTEAVKELPYLGGYPPVTWAEYDEMLTYFAARCVLSEFVGPKFIPSGAEDNAPWPPSYKHKNRVTLLGEALFLMRSSPAFPEFCRRLRTRDEFSSSAEMLVAPTFFKSGYVIYAREEVGAKGQDFDFWATIKNATVNVEVTRLTAAKYSANTIMNALQTKRKQVPDTVPAVIHCIIPEQWSKEMGDNWSSLLRQVAERFLRTTRRINHVVFMYEENIEYDVSDPAASTGGLLIRHFSVHNISPRIKMKEEIRFLYEGISGNKVRQMMIEKRDHKIVPPSEFDRWVEYLLS